MSHCIRKPTICMCKNKDTDQLRSNGEADQRLFRYMDSTIHVQAHIVFSSTGQRVPKSDSNRLSLCMFGALNFDNSTGSLDSPASPSPGVSI